ELRHDAYQTKVLSVEIGAFAARHYVAKLSPVPPKAAVAEEGQQKAQSLGEIFLTKATEKPVNKKKSRNLGRASKTGARLAMR
ncbi:MAG: hypothetical protein HY901_01625, partial [Deltaproteobacteria bacterium]|nr:hypothetical protein [Deltaproteobacteria bacterium]